MNKNKDNETNIKEHNLIKNVFLDTNIFSSAKFNYNSGNLCKFLENAKEYSIQVYITSVVETEIKKQIKDFSQKHHEAIYNAILNGVIEHDMEFTRCNDFCDYMESRLLELFSNMIDDYDIKIIPCSLNGDDTDLLMDMHYDIKPPFTKDKKSEFKDSISLINILNFIRKKDIWHNTIFVTLDNSCILFCRENKMKYCRYINKVSDLILSQNDHDKFIEKNRDTIFQYLRAYFNDRKIDYCIESNLWNSEDCVDI
ncbi:PIN domain-containing protein, partial [uncultured Campylobacter sp.]|uniref:PIN domain-containing protein n=1 Tax=uncultured Campylobacter sp. TaxID=218934 RepID=UPI0028E4FACB